MVNAGSESLVPPLYGYYDNISTLNELKEDINFMLKIHILFFGLDFWGLVIKFYGAAGAIPLHPVR